MKRKLFFTATMCALMFSTFAFARGATKDTSTPPPNLLPPPVAKPAGLSNCFDYYTFGSIQTSVTPSLAQVSQGSVIAFSGTVTNKNDYPIVDATVYVKIFHDRTGGTKNVNGPDIVDWFPAIEHFALKANESLPLNFKWQVPFDADPGFYKAALYVVSSDRFMLSGIVFTDDVVGSVESFNVVGSTSGDTHFDKTGVTLNGESFHFVALPPIIASTTKDIAVSARLVNTSERTYNGKLSWKLYSWDQLQESRLVTSVSEDVSVNADDSTTVSYTITDTKHALYYLIGTFISSTSGAKSIIGIRFSRVGIAEPRFAFAGINAYPPNQATAFVCMHAVTSLTPVEGARVDLSVVPSGFIAKLFGTIAEVSYTGTILDSIYALSVPVESGATSFDIKAKLYGPDGTLIDSVTIPYRCGDLGAPCDKTDFYAILAIGILILLIIAIVIIKRSRRQGEPDFIAASMPSTMPSAPVAPPPAPAPTFDQSTNQTSV